MRDKLIYLAGPISGCTYDGCTRWREEVKSILEPLGVHCLSPMRAKEHLQDVGVLHGSYDQHVLSTSRGIMCRDFNDCAACDLLFVNLLGVTEVSIGTVMEIAWAHARRVPVVCVMDNCNVHDHPMINEAIDFRVNMVDEAIQVAIAVLDLA